MTESLGFEGAAAANRKKLYLEFHGRVIEHLGIQMYQSPVNAIAELIANSWDADATLLWRSYSLIPSLIQTLPS